MATMRIRPSRDSRRTDGTPTQTAERSNGAGDQKDQQERPPPRKSYNRRVRHRIAQKRVGSRPFLPPFREAAPCHGVRLFWRNAKSRNNQTPLVPLDHSDFRQVPHLLEAEAGVDPSGGLVVVEMHAQKSRDPQPRTFADDELFEPPTDALPVCGCGHVDADLGGGVIGGAAGVERRR